MVAIVYAPLSLIVLPGDGSTEETNHTICEGEVFLFGGEEYTESGTYMENLAGDDCDGTVVVHLEVLKKSEAGLCRSDHLRRRYLYVAWGSLLCYRNL